MRWLVRRNGQQGGPFDRSQMQALIAQGRLAPQDMVLAEGSAGWVAAGQAGFVWPRAKRRMGCLGCLGLLALGVVLVVGGVVVWLRWRDSGNLRLGKTTELVRVTVAAGGGVVRAGGITIDVGPEAYGKPVEFVVRSTEITGSRMKPLFHAVTPLITIDNGHEYSKDPMVVRIPVAIGRDEFAMGFYYDRKTGRLEGLPLVGEDAGGVTVLTRHFSDLVITKAKKAEIVKGLPADSGFAPGVDDWQFANYGSWLAPPGHCSGQAMSAMWYFVEKKKGAGERALYGRYDNNDYGMGTIDLQEDDSWGYRFASMVHREMDFSGIGYRIIRKFRGFDTGLTWFAFAYAIQMTEEPQHIEIWDEQMGVGHAMVVYKADAGGLGIADPNYPGRGDRRIVLANGGLLPYHSGETKADIDAGRGIRFPVLLYIGKTAVADWGKIAARYGEVVSGKIGQDTFPKWTVRYLIQEGAEKKWPEAPKVIQTDEATTAKPGAGYLGKLRFEVKFPYSDPQKFRVALYEDTRRSVEGAFDARGEYYFTYNLGKGVNNIGLYYYKLDDKGNEQYIDFRRIKVLYGEDDLSGTWKGEMTVRGTERFRKYVEDGIVLVLRAFLPDRSEGELRGAAAGAIEMHVETLPFAMTLRNGDGGRYSFEMNYRDAEGRSYSSSGEARYEAGVLRWRAKAGDGSVADYEGQLAGKDMLRGTIDINAWGILPKAATSEWRAGRGK